MPSTYAHYRFGEQVRGLLSEDKTKIIEKYPQLFRIGLHGPDILFYYHPLTSDPVNQIGYELHDQSGQAFFEHASKVIREHEGDERYLSYVYGVFTHFALDLSCHGYVESRVVDCGISHTETEVEFDRFLLEMDGKHALSHLSTMHIAATKENAEVITAFYPGTGKEDILASLRGMIFFHKLLLCRTSFKRNLLYGIMRLIGKYETFHTQIMSATANEKCEESNQILHSLYRAGRKKACLLIEEYDANGSFSEAAKELLAYNFGSVYVGEEENLEK